MGHREVECPPFHPVEGGHHVQQDERESRQRNPQSWQLFLEHGAALYHRAWRATLTRRGVAVGKWLGRPAGPAYNRGLMVMPSRLFSSLSSRLRSSRLAGESGQGVTENMLIISVVVISVIGGAQSFIGTFRSGVQELGNDVSAILMSGSIGGVGSGGSGGGGGSGASSGGARGGTGNGPSGAPPRSEGEGGFNTNSMPGGRFGNGSFDTANNNRDFGFPLGQPQPPSDTA